MPKLIDMVRSNAPLIGTMLGATGPLGAAAGAVLNAVLGLPKDAGPKAAEEALAKATPEQILALKKADQDFALSMRQVDLDEYKADLVDVQNARQREVQLADKNTSMMGWTILCGFIGVVGAIVFFIFTGHAVTLRDPTIAALLGTVVGYVNGSASQVIGYYFGSSAGSKAKTDAMSAAISSGR